MADLYCIKCGERVREDTSPGVYLHDIENPDEGYDLDEDHAATPELEADGDDEEG